MECEKIYMNGLTRRITTLNEKIIYSKNQNDEKAESDDGYLDDDYDVW